MIKMMRAAVGCTFAVAAVAALAGCPGGGVPGMTGPSAMPSGAGGATCDQTTPAGNVTSTGTSAHGNYNGQRLPANWDTQLKSESDVTTAITGISTGPAATWACFQGFYPGATQIWKNKTGK